MTKALVITLLFLAGRLFSAFPDANTIAYYPLAVDATDASGNGHHGTVVGSLPFVRYPFVGAGPFTDSDYVQLPASFRTAWSSQAAWTREWNIYFISFPNTNNCVIDTDTSGTQTTAIVVNDGKVRSTVANIDVASAAGVVATVTVYNIAETYNGTTRKIYVNNVEVVSTATTGTIGTVTASRIGRYTAATGLYINGYIGQVMFSNIARTSFPTIPIDFGNTQLSPYLKNSNRLNINPPRMFNLLNLLLPKQLWAMETNTLLMGRENQNHFLIASHRNIRATPTRSPTPRIGTPTATPTASPTATPTQANTPRPTATRTRTN